MWCFPTTAACPARAICTRRSTRVTILGRRASDRPGGAGGAGGAGAYWKRNLPRRQRMDIACEEEFTAAQATEVLVQIAAGFKDFIRTGGRNVKRKGRCSKMNVESQCASQCASQSFCARKPVHCTGSEYAAGREWIERVGLAYSVTLSCALSAES